MGAWDRPINVPAGTSVILSPHLGGVCVGVTNSQVWTSGIGKTGAPTCNPQEVERFIIQHNLGKQCADRVRGLPKHLQHQVITAGPIDGARSADGVVFTRIKEAEQDRSGALGAATYASSFTKSGGGLPSIINPEIEQMISQNRL